MKIHGLADKIKEVTDALGIDVIGFAKAAEFNGYPLKHSKRRDPPLWLPGASTIIVSGIYTGSFVLPSWNSTPYQH